MPHKRAKRSVREQQKASRIADEAPNPTSNIANEGIPKSISRVLDATKIRSEFKAIVAKRKREQDEGSTTPAPKKKKLAAGGSKLVITPGESLAHFNRRVEDDMRPLLKSAILSSAAIARKAKKSNGKDSAKKAKPVKEVVKADSPPPPPPPRRATATEFAKSNTSAPRRLNDIALAPPQINKVPRGAARAQKKREDAGETSGSGVVSIAQKLMMETERELVIQRYRELKERRLQSGVY